MENMDDVRRSIGTVADFSGWEGIKAKGGFRAMKISTKEKVIEKTDEELENDEEFENNIYVDKNKEVVEPKERKKLREIPAANEAVINPLELKSIAVSLLPKVDSLEKGEKYVDLCEKAIDMAFTFLKVWNLKVEIGEKNG